MNDLILILLAFVSGIALGVLFFGGLWFTIRVSINSKVPAIWFFISLTLRLCITLLGFYYIGVGSWQRLIVCVLGFVLARIIVLHITKKHEEKQLKKEVNYEA